MKYIGKFDDDPLGRHFIDGYAEWVYTDGVPTGTMDYIAPGYFKSDKDSPFIDIHGRIWTETLNMWRINKLNPEMWQR